MFAYCVYENVVYNTYQLESILKKVSEFSNMWKCTCGNFQEKSFSENNTFFYPHTHDQKKEPYNAKAIPIISLMDLGT